jgi:hypothetical protein
VILASCDDMHERILKEFSTEYMFIKTEIESENSELLVGASDFLGILINRQDGFLSNHETYLNETYIFQ